MTSEDVRAELDQSPFLPFRLHLVSGKTVDIRDSGEGWMLQNAILVTPRIGGNEESYHVVALRNIERVERLTQKGSSHD